MHAAQPVNPRAPSSEGAAPDEDGNLVVHEALPPGGEITLRITMR